jgi:hypothetical protein
MRLVRATSNTLLLFTRTRRELFVAHYTRPLQLPQKGNKVSLPVNPIPSCFFRGDNEDGTRVNMKNQSFSC